ncbi:Neurogenic locus Notch protein [Holothuria leucospilota]|uniref:Neurogenic locus Notch protein n=1 Tax=Holothuria leucospilota TaxID=206669 RepID=A0A9Q1BXG8_HOLLE|nr:Neurogenic locus Notch protein [Holothuria leucospilota]
MTVTCTCTDSCQDTGSCTFIVNVDAPNTPPAITCPADFTVKVNVGATGDLVTFNPPVCIDPDQNNQNLAVSCNPMGNSFLPLGSNTVTCSCTDLSGGTDTCSFTVTVFQNTPPTIICPAPVRVISLPGNVGNTVTYNPPQCFDAEDNQNQLQTSCSQPSGAFFQGVGPMTVTCTCTDSCQDTDSCTFIVNIDVPNVPPIITCPADVTIKVNSGVPGGVVTYDNPGCIDPDGNNQNLVISCNPLSNSFSLLGLNDVTCTCTDLVGDIDSCSFFVNVIENTPPSISCPEPITLPSDAGNVGTTVFYGDPQCIDAEDTPNLLPTTCSQGSGTFFNVIGPTSVTCSCTDSCQETDTCTFVVTIEAIDETPPTIINCPADVTEIVEFGVPGAVVSWVEPTARDDSGFASIVSRSHVPNSFFVEEKTTVVYTFQDAVGNEATCEFCVIIIFAADNEPPVAICPGDVTGEVLRGNEGTIVTFQEPFATDNSGSVELANSPQWYSGFYFPVGVTPVLYTFSDDAGNTASCNFLVTVVEVSPCDSNPCQNAGVCFALSLTDFTCVCPPCFQGTLCEISIPNPCNLVNNCQNGGECQLYEGSCTQTFCECQQCTRGDLCEIRVNPCDDNPCQNGAQCVPDPEDCCAYTCQCLGCFTGPLCADLFNPCTPNPCNNNGVCVQSPGSCLDYTCQCQGCFDGFNCQNAILDPCIFSPCLNGGRCSRTPGSCSTYTCDCLDGFSGPLCQDRVVQQKNPCLAFPCENDGCCVTLSNNNYKCLCRDGYAGFNCESRTGPLVPASCDSSPCQNGATCYNSYSSDSPEQFYIPQYTCACPNGFSGTNCATSTAQNVLLDTCRQSGRICLNQGTCQNTFCSFNQDMGTFCNCREGFYGENCEFTASNPCFPSPCRNGGQCMSFTKYFVCQCPFGFSGITCEVPGIDDTPPTIINCPQDITVTANAGENFAIVTWPEFFVNDNSGVVTLVRGTGAPDARYLVGTRSIQYQYRDPAGNTASCEFQITVLPSTPVNTPPSAPVCPTVTETAAAGQTLAVVFYDTIVCADDQQGSIVAACTQPSGSSFPIGQSQVSCTCTDNGGLTNGCTFNVVVQGVCNPSPCLNGGTCFPAPGTLLGFACQCINGFTGQNCQTPITGVCLPSPCVNGGICQVDPTTPSGVRCINCATGFAGELCAEDLVIVQDLTQGVFASDNIRSGMRTYADGLMRGWIIQGTANLDITFLQLDLRPGDILRYGPGNILGVAEIDSFNGDTLASIGSRASRPLTSNSMWVAFTTNNDGNAGTGFAIRIQQGISAPARKRRSLRSDKNDTRVSQRADRSTALADIFLGNQAD